MPPPLARRPRPLAAATALLLGTAVVAAGCAKSQPAAAPPPQPTPIARLNTAALHLPRIDFCKRVPSSAVSDALGAKPSDSAAYGNGDTEPRSGAPADVLHELGCVWSSDNGATARAWVFARPVTREFAGTVARKSNATPGCKQVGGPAFGEAAYTQQCTLAGGTPRVRHAGLFGQTWFTCEVAGPARTPLPQVGKRADAWCVEVAESLSTSR